MHQILRYPGAKRRLAEWIIGHMPAHEGYLEPYFGSGAIFFAKQKSRIETINDLDGDVYNFFAVCREHPDELCEALALTPYARQERNAAYERPDTDDPIEKARRFAVKCWMTFGAFPNKYNGWRHTTGCRKDGGPDNPKLWKRLPECVAFAAERLRDAQIENRPALDVILAHNGPECLIYADPPYIRDTRTAHHDAYAHEMTDADHEALLRALRSHTGPVLLSGYDHEMYRDMLLDWRIEQKNTTAECAVKRTESLWINITKTHPDDPVLELPYGAIIATAELVECWQVILEGHDLVGRAVQLETKNGAKTNIIGGRGCDNFCRRSKCTGQ
jgi:DNA adenine methylase